MTLAIMGWTEILILMLIVLIIFGASRLPEIGRGLGTGIQEFKKSIKGSGKDDEVDSDEKKKELPH